MFTSDDCCLTGQGLRKKAVIPLAKRIKLNNNILKMRSRSEGPVFPEKTVIYFNKQCHLTHSIYNQSVSFILLTAKYSFILSIWQISFNTRLYLTLFFFITFFMFCNCVWWKWLCLYMYFFVHTIKLLSWYAGFRRFNSTQHFLKI